jgi:hypothetical protein
MKGVGRGGYVLGAGDLLCDFIYFNFVTTGKYNQRITCELSTYYSVHLFQILRLN